MKIFQRMNRRDRSLIMLLLAAVTFYLCYTYIMVPQMNKAEILKGNLKSVQDQLVLADQLTKNIETLKTDEIDLKNKLIEKYSTFFYDLKQARLLNRVDAIRTGVGMPASSYLATPEQASQVPIEEGSFIPPNFPLKELAMQINPELNEQIELNQPSAQASQEQQAPSDQEEQVSQDNAVQSTDMVLGTDVTVGFVGASYESIYNFIMTVEKMNKTVVLKNISITKDDAGLSGQLIFSFYSLPKLDPTQKDGLDYTPATPIGKTNPFI